MSTLSARSFASIPTTVASRPEAALAHAVHVARRLRTHLEVVRVVDAPSPVQAEVALSDTRGVLRRWRAERPGDLRVEPSEAIWGGGGDPCADEGFCAGLAETRASMIVANRREGLGTPAAQAALVARVAQRARVPVLAVGDEDVVDPETGRGRLGCVVVPVSTIRNVQGLTEAAVWLGSALGADALRIVFVHIRPEPTTMALRPPILADDSIRFTSRVGEPVPALVAEAIEQRADAVVLPLGIEIGSSGAILDSEKLEALMRALPMPVLTVPMRHRWRPPEAAEGVRVIQTIPAAPRVRGRTTALWTP